jgi:hypothetical protein
VTKEIGDERFGSEEPTKPGGPPSVESAIQSFTLALAELERDGVESGRVVAVLEGDERRRRLIELAEKMESCSSLVGNVARVVRAIAELGG